MARNPQKLKPLLEGATECHIADKKGAQGGRPAMHRRREQVAVARWVSTDDSCRDEMARPGQVWREKQNETEIMRERKRGDYISRDGKRPPGV